MNINPKVLKRFVIYMAILTFVMFTVWGFVRSFMDRPPGDYETEVCDIRLKDKKYEEALEAADKALNKTPYHRGAMMCKALVFISEKKYVEANRVLSNLIIFLEKNVEEDEGIKDYTQFDGINDDWEEFNERDFSASKGGK